MLAQAIVRKACTTNVLPRLLRPLSCLGMEFFVNLLNGALFADFFVDHSDLYSTLADGMWVDWDHPMQVKDVKAQIQDEKGILTDLSYEGKPLPDDLTLNEFIMLVLAHQAEQEEPAREARPRARSRSSRRNREQLQRF